ncbi:hypothetical protein K503DRAFT_802745 [Rhizopogon vinicolor AM-OR11-026]|uniref:Uncharacterized protein n=1 Tax=Rhizopogon vinicolor AM-OR11-026 TaxID=1314800 RepID=A0A1B7MSE9_9AGAM|nr:hypothetical protein K503DRAFT_802745 [Rhizopogon vinicolor AM-OR11-026]
MSDFVTTVTWSDAGSTATSGRRSKQTARKSTGSKPPRKQVITEDSYQGSSCSSDTSQDLNRASLCSRFADWLDRLGESEQDKRISDAVERDGGKLFYLIQRTLEYERILEGLEEIDEEIPRRLIDLRIKTLRDFAYFLMAKEWQDGISMQLSLAIERDGKQLFHLASCCLNFGSAINGEGV